MKFCEISQPEAARFLSPMIGNEKWDTTGGLFGVNDVIGGGRTFAALGDDGMPTVVFVVEQQDHERGRELVIRVARQIDNSGDLTERVLPEIERVFGAGCNSVVLHTRRAGLVRKLQKTGYAESAKIMRKKL